ncbi:MAG: PQQ-binding-like beta-propeller repeat protein [Candidatus Cloacimonetes bacterium]|nr:PQQ-binding-like beta-propeller repeat protein [Candidatus Cloacimonadota bacterium]
MIKLIRNSESCGVSQTYFDYFPRQKRNYFLQLDHYNQDPYTEKMEEYVLGEFIKLKLEQYSISQLQNVLREFFIKLNWQLYSIFSQRQDLERGLSLALTITEEEKLYFVKFGRFSAGLLSEDKLEKLGDWKNPAVLSYAEIGLLGAKDEDIRVKIQEYEIPVNSYFLVITSSQAVELEKIGIHHLSIIENLEQLLAKDCFSFLLLYNNYQKAHSHRYWMRKKRVNRTAIILLILIIMSAVYVYWGSNIIDDFLARFKFQSKEFTRNELKEQFIILQEQAQELLDQISQEDMRLALIPQQKIKIDKAWEIDLHLDITVSPLFDHYQIYLAGGSTVFAIDKDKHNIVWQKQFNSPVEVLRMVDANRVLVALENGIVMCLSRDDGKKHWEKEFDLRKMEEFSMNLNQISLNQYRQLDESLFLIHEGSRVSLGLIRNGEIITDYDAGSDIDSVSSYDLLDKCLYLTQARKLIKLNIKVIL